MTRGLAFVSSMKNTAPLMRASLLVALLVPACGGAGSSTLGTGGKGSVGGNGSGGSGGSGSGLMGGHQGATGGGDGGQGGAGVGARGGSGVGGEGHGGAGQGGVVGSAGVGGGGGVLGGGQGGAVPIGGGPGGVYTCTPGVEELVITDCGYPTTSASPLTSTTFNENEVLRAIRPGGSWPHGVVQMFYNDEHAMTLGVRQVVVKSTSGTTTTDYPITELATDPGSSTAPQTGTTILGGDQSGLDPSLRPMWPSLFVTDISTNPGSRAGDWQQGGVPVAPGAIFGSWKAAVRTVDKTKTPATVTITPDKDPTKNNWTLPGGDPIPTGLENEGYGSEVRWDVTLIPGHSYRLQVLVHDGDQNKAGGDSGEACVLFCAGGSGCGSECETGGGGGMGGNTPMCPSEAPPCGAGGEEPAACSLGSACIAGCCVTVDG